jgi:hypothetical protein
MERSCVAKNTFIRNRVSKNHSHFYLELNNQDLFQIHNIIIAPNTLT